MVPAAARPVYDGRRRITAAGNVDSGQLHWRTLFPPTGRPGSPPVAIVFTGAARPALATRINRQRRPVAHVSTGSGKLFPVPGEQRAQCAGSGVVEPFQTALLVALPSGECFVLLTAEGQARPYVAVVGAEVGELLEH